MSAPVIGLSAYAEPAQWAVWQAPAALLARPSFILRLRFEA